SFMGALALWAVHGQVDRGHSLSRRPVGAAVWTVARAPGHRRGRDHGVLHISMWAVLAIGDVPRGLSQNDIRQEGDMKITKNTLATTPGSRDWFTGTVYIDTIAVPAQGSRLNASCVHFTPGARTAWHTHPHGQTIYVTEGVGLAQRRGGPIEVIQPGDRVFFEPGEDHWHGASATRFMTHLSMLQVDEEGNSATWGAHVTDE